MNGLLKFITCGSVDDGKSTLIGHILYDSKLLFADQEKALLLDSKAGSREGKIDYSLLLDGLMAEREQGITIDVAYRYFTTKRRSFIVADTPGHEEYTRNMAVGASFAQLAVILVDAKQGVLVQTRRHSRICALMGIEHFVFAVNKMDLVDYSEKRFEEITAEIKELSEELHLGDVKIMPVSATEGDNVTVRSEHMPWYTEEVLLDWLETVDVSEQVQDTAFYMPVQRVCRPSHTFRGFQGQIESGKIAVGDEITTLPSHETAQVKAIYVGNKEVTEAFAGQPVNIQLSREVDVSRGCVLTNDDGLPIVRNIQATLLWMDDEKLAEGKDYLLKLGTKHIPAIVKKIVYKTDVNTGARLEADELSKNEIALCEIELSEKIVADKFSVHKTLGELILIDRVSHMTSACGVVEEADQGEEKPYFKNGEIKAGGFVFEEFYFNLENAYLTRQRSEDVQYQVGDEVPVEGDSFHYPDFFDVVSVEDEVAVLVRNRKITEIKKLSDYSYSGVPVLDERGFELKIHSVADMENFRREFKEAEEQEKQSEKKEGMVDATAEVYNKWSRFETYRRVICNTNFWFI